MKTAVEWLVEELKGVYESDYLNKLVEQAKEMEKEQIIDAASDHCYPTRELALIDAQQYYNETFKSK
jgi:vacuolar-type H+-ATPase subunit H